MPVQKQSLIGTLALAFVVALALFWIVLAGIMWGGLDGGYYGWNLGSDGRTIVYVTPGSKVDKAGITAGDRVDWATLPLLGRTNLALEESAPLDGLLTLTVFHGGAARTVSMLPTRWEDHEQNQTRVSFIVQIVLIGIGVALVCLRPSRMTWGFLVAWLSWPTAIWSEHDTAKFLLVNGSASLLLGVSAAGLLTFVSRFPKDRPQGALVYLDRLAIPYGTLVAALGLSLDVMIAYSVVPPPQWLAFMIQSGVPALTAATLLLALVISYATTSSADRQRILPVLAAFAFLELATAVYQIYIANFTGGFGQYAFADCIVIGQLLLAVAVAHGIIKNRVVDLSFTISRTLVYTVLTSILLGAFALVDVVSAHLFEHLQIALFLEALVALAFGIWLKRLHAQIDGFVDRVLFRHRHLAEERLHRTARTLTHAESATFIDEALVIEASDAFDLASAAVFRAEGDAFVRVVDVGWKSDDVTTIQQDDHLVVNLRAELQAIDLLTVRWPRADVPKGLEHPILAIPLVVRHEVLGFVLYGGHKGGEAIDPDENRTLVHLAHAAASAYEHIRAKTLVAESSALRNQNAVLQEKEHLLREMVDALKRPSTSSG